jgi:hypothetical protein
MNRSTKTLLAASVLVFCGCSSTELKSSWRDPSVSRIDITRLVTVAITPDPALRRTAEDAMAQEIKNVPTVPSYSILTPQDEKDLQQARAKLKDAGIDGAVTMRLISMREKPTYVAPAPIGTREPFWGYYGTGWSSVNEPGYWGTDTYARIETRLYSIPDQKLIWSGTSETFNPSDAQRVVAEVVQEAGKDLRKQGLIGKKEG